VAGAELLIGCTSRSKVVNYLQWLTLNWH